MLEKINKDDFQLVMKSYVMQQNIFKIARLTESTKTIVYYQPNQQR